MHLDHNIIHFILSFSAKILWFVAFDTFSNKMSLWIRHIIGRPIFIGKTIYIYSSIFLIAFYPLWLLQFPSFLRSAHPSKNNFFVSGAGWTGDVYRFQYLFLASLLWPDAFTKNMLNHWIVTASLRLSGSAINAYYFLQLSMSFRRN